MYDIVRIEFRQQKNNKRSGERKKKHVETSAHLNWCWAHYADCDECVVCRSLSIAVKLIYSSLKLSIWAHTETGKRTYRSRTRIEFPVKLDYGQWKMSTSLAIKKKPRASKMGKHDLQARIFFPLRRLRKKILSFTCTFAQFSSPQNRRFFLLDSLESNCVTARNPMR